MVTFRWTLLALAAVAPISAFAECDLKVTSLHTVDADAASHRPKLGETYYMRVNWTVTGTPSGPYDIKFEMANRTHVWRLTTGAGNFYGFVGWKLPLDTPFPIKVTLDAANEQADTDRTSNVRTETVRPVLPTSAITWYGAKTIYAKHSASVTMGPTSNWSRLIMLSGTPKSETFQTVLNRTSTNGTLISTEPTAYPAMMLDMPNPPAGATQSIIQHFKLKQKNCKINPNKILDDWAAFETLPTDIMHWTKPETVVPSTDPAIAAFVARTLPKEYKTKLSPVKAARRVYLGVVKELTYKTPAALNAVTVLNLKWGDCGGFTTLYVASLRSMGIPARMRSGFGTGTNNWHVWPEIYMPSVGWIPQDPTWSDGIDPDGTYAYYFANLDDLTNRCSLGTGNTFKIPTLGFTSNIFQSFTYWGYWSERGADSFSYEVKLSDVPIP